jgi:catechol 2,3-dioxygenase-like lactoylglutathione lyase family enzyme
VPQLDQINIVVRDMPAAVAFYRQLGVEIADTMAEWEPHHRPIASTREGIDADLDSAAFAQKWNAGWPPDRAGVVIGFRVESRQAVDALYAAVVGAGYRGQQPPYDTFWGARYAVVEDPDGNAVGLMSPIDEAARTAPPDPP